MVDDDFIYEEIDTDMPEEEEDEAILDDDMEEAEEDGEFGDDDFDEDEGDDEAEVGSPTMLHKDKMADKSKKKTDETVWDKKKRQMDAMARKTSPKDELKPSKPIIDLSHVKVVVLDEVDRMLAMGCVSGSHFCSFCGTSRLAMLTLACQTPS